MEISEHLQGILDTLPTKPGCYLMKNAGGKIIYVGKAINLRARVRSYFHSDSSHDNKTRRLVHEIADIEWIVVGSELEALILEMNLIKRHRPRFNVRLKDDKRYPYIKIHWADPYPKVTVTRQMKDDGCNRCIFHPDIRFLRICADHHSQGCIFQKCRTMGLCR